MLILGPLASPTTSAATWYLPSSSGSLTTLPPSTTSRAGSVRVEPTSPVRRSTVRTSSTDAFSCLPPQRTIAYTETLFPSCADPPRFSRQRTGVACLLRHSRRPGHPCMQGSHAPGAPNSQATRFWRYQTPGHPSRPTRRSRPAGKAPAIEGRRASTHEPGIDSGGMLRRKRGVPALTWGHPAHHARAELFQRPALRLFQPVMESTQRRQITLTRQPILIVWNRVVLIAGGRLSAATGERTAAGADPNEMG